METSKPYETRPWAFRCPECGLEGTTTFVPLPREMGGGRYFSICSDPQGCGCVGEIAQEQPSENPDYLACIPFEGVGSDLPTGRTGDKVALRTPRNYRIKYTTATGASLTWLEFVKRYGRDPEVLLEAQGMGRGQQDIYDIVKSQHVQPTSQPFKIGRGDRGDNL
jgi:hypothetical protein